MFHPWSIVWSELASPPGLWLLKTFFSRPQMEPLPEETWQQALRIYEPQIWQRLAGAGGSESAVLCNVLQCWTGWCYCGCSRHLERKDGLNELQSSHANTTSLATRPAFSTEFMLERNQKISLFPLESNISMWCFLIRSHMAAKMDHFQYREDVNKWQMTKKKINLTFYKLFKGANYRAKSIFIRPFIYLFFKKPYSWKLDFFFY